MSERKTLPVLPLREVVLFPGVTAPIGAGRPATLRAIEAALQDPEKLVFAVSQRENVETVTAESLYTIGTIARIGQLPCGLLMTPHPQASSLIERLEGKAPLIGSGQCRAYAAKGRAALNQRLAREAAAK